MKWLLHINFFFLLALVSNAQGDLEIYRGNKAFKEKDYTAARTHYNSALNQNPESFKGVYNLGNTDYREENYEEAIARYQQAAANANTDRQKAEAYHNLGNSYLKSQKLKESVEAYKQSLRLDPTSDETRYNLAYAQKLLKQQQQQEKQDQDKENEDQEDKEDQQDKDQEKDGQDKNEEKNQDKKEQDNKDGDKEKEQDKEQGDQQKDKQDQQDKNEGQQKQPKPVKISPREAEQMLDAARNQDQKIQMQLKKRTDQAEKRKIEKDW